MPPASPLPAARSPQALLPSSGENLLAGIAWSEMKLLSVSGLAGGLVTVSDIIAHEMFHRRRTPATTLALDLAMGMIMAGGAWPAGCAGRGATVPTTTYWSQ